MKHILALLGLLTGTVAAHCQPARVYSDAGNIFIERASGTTKLTASEMDVDPVLSPNGASRTNSAPPSRGLMSCGASIWMVAMTGSC